MRTVLFGSLGHSAWTCWAVGPFLLLHILRQLWWNSGSKNIQIEKDILSSEAWPVRKLFMAHSVWITIHLRCEYFQHGRQDLVVWLVTNTRERDRLQTRDGDRCLLHAAAKYGQVRQLIKMYRIYHFLEQFCCWTDKNINEIIIKCFNVILVT